MSKAGEASGVLWEKLFCVYFHWFVSVDTISIILLTFEEKIQKSVKKHQVNYYSVNNFTRAQFRKILKDVICNALKFFCFFSF